MKGKQIVSRFSTMLQADVPHSRRGKHNDIVLDVLDDLKRLKSGSAMQIPLDSLGGSKQNVRSAINRATRKAGIDVATASDEEFLYLWVK